MTNTTNNVDPQPEVSVLIITYNHEQYIAQSISSALMQQTDFSFEIVIGEDCSSDRTRSIVASFQNQYPQKIRVLFNQSNLGLYGKINLINTLMACRGKYIALLEGDDYWISPEKLSLQVNFLREHPECTICFHQSFIRDKENNNNNIYPPYQFPEINTIEDIFAENFMQTCSVMFKNGLIKRFPNWFYELYFSDWPLHILNAEHGKIGFIDRVMSVYRRHDGGVWTSSRGILQYKTIIHMLYKIDEHFQYRYRSVIQMHLSRMYLGMSIFCFRNGYVRDGFHSLLRIFPLQITMLLPFWFQKIIKILQSRNIRASIESLFPVSRNKDSAA